FVITGSYNEHGCIYRYLIGFYSSQVNDGSIGVAGYHLHQFFCNERGITRLGCISNAHSWSMFGIADLFCLCLLWPRNMSSGGGQQPHATPIDESSAMKE